VASVNLAAHEYTLAPTWSL